MHHRYEPCHAISAVGAVASITILWVPEPVISPIAVVVLSAFPDKSTAVSAAILS